MNAERGSGLVGIYLWAARGERGSRGWGKKRNFEAKNLDIVMRKEMPAMKAVFAKKFKLGGDQGRAEGDKFRLGTARGKKDFTRCIVTFY